MPAKNPTVRESLADQETPATPKAKAAPAPKAKDAPAAEGGDEAEATLSAEEQKGLRELIAKAVGEALKEQIAEGKAAAFHDEERHNRKSFIDDEVDDVIGAERAEIRRENERKTQLAVERGIPSSFVRDGGPGERNEKKAGNAVAEYIGWMTAASGDVERAHRFAKRGGGSKTVVRALGESTFAGGGAFVPENIANDYIELLYNASVYLQAGPQRMSVPNGNLTLPKLTGGATPTWIGESDNIAKSEQTTGSVRIDLRKLAVLTPASNEFVQDSGPSAIEMIRNDLQAIAAVTIDGVALRSLGTAHQPRGLRGWVPSANQFASGGTTVAQITADLGKANRLIEEGKIMSNRLAWFTSPRTKWGLMSARDANNNLVWAQEMAQGTLWGAKFFSTQNIPTNVGSGSTKSELYLVAMEHQIFAEDPRGVRIDVADGAAYHDGSAVVAGFSRDEMVVRLIQRLDTVSRQAGAEIVQIYDVAIA